MNNNRQIYESEKVVRNYKKLHGLFPAEKKLYDIIKNTKNKQVMLDLGVGAGRTTNFFASNFNNYVGVDFSSVMIDVCRKKFTHLKNVQFINADVASLPELSSDSFNFVLFSLNGIDYLKNLDERIILLSNIYKLLKEDGIFAFSTHNTKAITRVYSFQLPKRNPLKLIPEYFRYKKVREINGAISLHQNKNFCQLYDGGEYFGALTSYILPSYQIVLLRNVGFKKIQTIDIKGNNIPIEKIDTCNDNWVHYICYKN